MLMNFGRTVQPKKEKKKKEKKDIAKDGEDNDVDKLYWQLHAIHLAKAVDWRTDSVFPYL